MKEKILWKFENNKFKHLTVREFQYITSNHDFALQIIRQYLNKKECYEYSNVIYYLERALSRWILNDINVFNQMERYVYNHIDNVSEDGLFAFLHASLDYPEEISSRIFDYAYKRIEKLDTIEYCFWEIDLIKKFLDDGKFEFIYKIKKIDSYIWGKLMSNLLDKYSFSEYGIPAFILNIFDNTSIHLDSEFLTVIIDEIGIDKVPINLLFNVLLNEIFFNVHSDRKKIINEFVQRFINNPEEVNDFLRTRPGIMNKIFNNVDFLLDREILKMLYENKIYCFADLMFLAGFVTPNQILDEMSEYVEDDKYFYFIREILISSDDFIFIIFENKKMIPALIKSGKLNFLLDYVVRYGDKEEKKHIFENILIEIKNGNTKFDYDLNCLSKKILRYPDFLNSLLELQIIYNFEFLEGRLIDDTILNYWTQNKEKIRFPECLSETDNPIILKLCSDVEFIKRVLVKPSILKATKFKERFIKILENGDINLDFDALFQHRNWCKVLFYDERILKFFLRIETTDKLEIIYYANHHEHCNFFYTVENALLLKNYLLDTYIMKEENFVYLVENVGPEILKFLENDNIIKLLNMDIEILKKICALFPNVHYTLDDLTAAYDSLMQYEFGIKHPEITEIFSRIIFIIEYSEDNRHDLKILHNLMTKILNYIDENYMKKFFQKYEMPEGINTKEEIMTFIIAKIKSNPNNTKYKNILHEFTDYYISKKREQLRNESDIYGDIKLPYNYSAKDSIKQTTKYMLSLNPTLQLPNGKITARFSDIFDRYLLMNGYKKGTAEDFLLAINTGSNKYFSEEQTNSLKRHAHILVSQFLRTIKFSNSFFTNISRFFPIKKEYYIPQSNNSYQVLSEVNFDIFINSVLKNDAAYESLKSTMKKRKLHLLPAPLSEYVENLNLDISVNCSNMSSFLTFYRNIYENALRIGFANGINNKSIILPFAKIMTESKVYDIELNYYSFILGSNDAKILSANRGPNAATRKTKNNIRLREAVNFTQKSFLRNKVTIPTFNEIFTIKNKSMRVIVGNFTHPSNLTHGERTGACMRIGGVGESLFEFVLTNQNGFHIRFEDPSTHEYISRVSGFRNGNTVFLNELRYSLNPDKYDNQDIVDFCTLAAKKLIELSKDSNYSIDNVVIHRAYATTEMKKPTTNLKVHDIKNGLPNFYSDVSNYAIVLATSAKNSTFVPLSLGVNNLPNYLPAREETMYSENLNDVVSSINRVQAINNLLTEQTPEYMFQELSFDSGFTCGYVNMDWYAYIDGEGIIHSKILNLDKRAEIELNDAIENLKFKRK